MFQIFFFHKISLCRLFVLTNDSDDELVRGLYAALFLMRKETQERHPSDKNLSLRVLLRTFERLNLLLYFNHLEGAYNSFTFTYITGRSGIVSLLKQSIPLYTEVNVFKIDHING